MCNNCVPVSIALILFLFYQAWPDKGFGVLCLWWKLRQIPFYVFNWHLLAGEAWICFCKGVLEEFCTDSSILISPSQIFCHSIFHQACSFLDLSYYFNSGANWDIKPWSLFSCTSMASSKKSIINFSLCISAFHNNLLQVQLSAPCLLSFVGEGGIHAPSLTGLCS